jgi:hypothetical protein
VSLFDPVPAGPRVRPLAADGQVVSLADVDPDLLRFVAPDRRNSARRELAIRLFMLPRGRWPIEPRAVDAKHLGLLVVDGILGRELIADDVTSIEFVGPGDLLRP